jgi:hypothetical protein
MTHSRNSRHFPTGRSQGSALITAVIFGTILLVGLAGLLPMLVNDWKQTSRTSLQEAAFTLAESGVEEAIWALTEFGDEDGNWEDAGWKEAANGNFWYREWNLAELTQSTGVMLDLDEDRSGIYRAVVQKTSGPKISVIGQGVVSGGQNVAKDTTIKRYIETEIDNPSSSGNPFAYGLIARRYMALNGQPTFDSYNSDFGEDPEEEMGPRDNVTVGGPSVDLSNFKITNPVISGDVVAGTPDGSAHPFDGKFFTGEKLYDFNMDFPEVVKPDTSSGTWNDSL